MEAVRENVASALLSLRANWLRTALTMLGIVIGVGSVALLVSIGLGVQKEVADQIQTLGSNLVFIVPGKLDRNSQPNPLALVGVSTLTASDVDVLRAQPGVHRVAPFMFVAGTVDYAQRAHPAFVVATTASWFAIRPWPLVEGRPFRDGEEGEAVCVLAHQPREQIFGAASPIGAAVTIQGIPFRVIGTLRREEQSAMFGSGGFENMVFIPARAAAAAIPRVQINRILLQTNPSLPPEQVLGEVERALRASHAGRDDFGVLTQKQLLGTVYRIMNLVTALLSGLTAISLVVAGIGIMNIMLVTVTERTHEIGIRKAVGARRRDIFQQFITEAVTIATIGGIVGIIVAVALCALVRRLSPLHPLVTPWVVVLAFGVCLAVGVVFGTLPAIRAARQDPMAALRYE